MTIETKAAPPVEKCAHCGAPLRQSDGYLHYFVEDRPNPHGTVMLVKVCKPDCVGKWKAGEDDYDERTRVLASGVE